MRINKEKNEIERIKALYANIPENKKKLVEGLIVQAARLRISLDELWLDLQKNGNTEPFRQNAEGIEFQRERPESKIFIARDKNYLAIIKKLDEMLPPEETKTGLSKLLDNDE